MLQRNILRGPATPGVARLASVAAFVIFAALLSTSCSFVREVDDLTEGCPDGTKLCGQDCVQNEDPAFGCSPDSCEPCQAVNATQLSCSNGACVVKRCDAAVSKLCGGECRALNSPEFGCGRPNSCSPCKLDRTSDYACSSFGSCEVIQCEGNWQDCNLRSDDGCESNKVQDSLNCGFCANRCPDRYPQADVNCGGSACVIRVCDKGFLNCDRIVENGCEIDFRVDNKNCGACKAACDVGAGQSCINGVCQ